jgi:hypothetical protein
LIYRRQPDERLISEEDGRASSNRKSNRHPGTFTAGQAGHRLLKKAL